MRDLPKLLLIRLIRLYQVVLSPWVGRQCRFIPTCSAYAIEALEVHGAVKGLFLTIARLLRCHPLGGHGYDPVPEHFSWRCLFRSNSENKQAKKNDR